MRMLLVLVLLASPALAQSEEDDAHRADRLQTQALNRNAAAVAGRRDTGNADAAARYARERARYERRLAEWRARVAACEAGNYAACD